MIGLAATASDADEKLFILQYHEMRLPCVLYVCARARNRLCMDKRRNKRDELVDRRTFRSQYNATAVQTAENVAGVRVSVKHLLANAPGRAVYQNV